jgi:hypothetical protein
MAGFCTWRQYETGETCARTDYCEGSTDYSGPVFGAEFNAYYMQYLGFQTSNCKDTVCSRNNFEGGYFPKYAICPSPQHCTNDFPKKDPRTENWTHKECQNAINEAEGLSQLMYDIWNGSNSPYSDSDCCAEAMAFRDCTADFTSAADFVTAGKCLSSALTKNSAVESYLTGNSSSVFETYGLDCALSQFKTCYGKAKGPKNPWPGSGTQPPPDDPPTSQPINWTVLVAMVGAVGVATYFYIQTGDAPGTPHSFMPAYGTLLA